MAERSFVMVKGDGVQLGLVDEIIKRLEAAGLKIVARRQPMLPDPEVVARHYPLEDNYLLTMGHRDPSGWTDEEKKAVIAKNRTLTQAMQTFMLCALVVPMIVEGPAGTVQKIREIVGKTNPAESPAGTIRGDFRDDSYADADDYLKRTGRSRSTRNIVHASGSPEEAEQEIANWFPELVS